MMKIGQRLYNPFTPSALSYHETVKKYNLFLTLPIWQAEWTSVRDPAPVPGTDLKWLEEKCYLI
jgi:hypothetical protein